MLLTYPYHCLLLDNNEITLIFNAAELKASKFAINLMRYAFHAAELSCRFVTTKSQVRAGANLFLF
jgi:hypothetical protein